MADEGKDLMKGLAVLAGVGVVLWAVFRDSDGEVSDSEAQSILESRSKLRNIRDKFWTVGPDCTITSTLGSYGPEELADAIDDELDYDLKEAVIYPAMYQAVVNDKINHPEDVAASILEQMFPECQWPPDSLAPDCKIEWNPSQGLAGQGSAFPTVTCSDAEGINAEGMDAVILWSAVLGLVTQACTIEESEKSKFRCTQDSATGEILLTRISV